MKGCLGYQVLLSGMLLIGSYSTLAADAIVSESSDNPAQTQQSVVQDVESVESVNANSDGIIINPSEMPNYPKPPKLTYEQAPFSLVNRYTWQLVNVEDSKHNVAHDHVKSLTLDIRPNQLVFTDDCQRYDVSFLSMTPGDFPYSYRDIAIESTCQNKELDNQSIALSELKNILRETDPHQYISRTFGLQWVDSENQPVDMSKLAASKLPQTAYLAISLDMPSYPKSTTRMMFKGTLKPIAKPNGIDAFLSQDFLEDFNWRLRQALDSSGQPIEVFGYADIPILGQFDTTKRDLYNNDTFSYASFSSDCNGIGGNYVLTPDNNLLIGYGVQTVMGCGTMREKAEDTLRELMHHSTSHLTLSYYVNAKHSSDEANKNSQVKTSSGTYMLTQDFETGEQLIWEAIDKPAYSGQ
ncbi:hypothetical protein [Psychrobacter sp. H7-1]|uniref:hypothetical protein n=1 Tax=Psychrobacter sp. H7-1 TaxID=1569265 RepID=UPI001919F4D7|nr:hypothetical protein [Psychrobacter sp. H7-1]